MDTNTRQIALSVLEYLREDLPYARLNDGRRVLDVADLRRYIYEQMGRIRTTALMIDDLFGNDNGYGQDAANNSGYNNASRARTGKKEERNTEAGQGFDHPAPATVSPGDIHRGG